jgi:NDP-sugar pyrophosphorylase family protein
MKNPEGESRIPTDAVCGFVLCGGAGTRLRPVLWDKPKSMAPVSGRPFLELLLERLARHGVKDVVLGTGYMAEQIEGHFGDGSKFGMRLRYSRENEPLGTGGALKLAEPFISDPVLVLNGDSYVEWELAPMLQLFTAKNAAAVMVVQEVSDVSRYGRVVLDHAGRVTNFVEKGASAGHGLINAGVYLIRRQVVQNLPSGINISLEREVFPRLLDCGVYGLPCTGLFIDIGIPDDFRRAQTILASRIHRASHGSSR